MPQLLGRRPGNDPISHLLFSSTILSSLYRSATYPGGPRAWPVATVTFTSLLLAVILLLFTPPVAAKLDVTVSGGNIQTFPLWDPMMGISNFYSMHGILFLAKVDEECVIRVDNNVANSTVELLKLLGNEMPNLVAIPILRYDWLDDCATFDEIFKRISDATSGVKAAGLPTIGAVVMDGNAKSTEDFGAPFQQLADAPHWNHDAGLNISYVGSDTIELLFPTSKANDGMVYVATVTQESGPWNDMWNSTGMMALNRSIDVLTGLVFFYGIWVLIFICKAEQDQNHTRRYLTLIPGILYLPLSIAFAPYKTAVPWRNAVYYVSLLFPFISLGLQIIMWSKLIYRIKRKSANKLFAYFSYVTIGVPTISAFLDGVGWLIPKVPIIRMIGEKGFMFCMPVIILVQASLIFYFAITFFRSLRNIAVSDATRTALVKITILNVAMVSFFILMLLSRIISLLGVNQRVRGAYLAELVVFRLSFISFYGCCFWTLSIRQPTGSTANSRPIGGSGPGFGSGQVQSIGYHGGDSTTLYNASSQPLSFQEVGSSKHEAGKNTHSHFKPGETPAKISSSPHEKKISRQSSKGFIIPSPDSSHFPSSHNASVHVGSSTPISPATSPTLTTRSAKKYQQYPGMRLDEEEEDKQSVYGNHLYQLKPMRNNKGSRQHLQASDASDEDHSIYAV